MQAADDANKHPSFASFVRIRLISDRSDRPTKRTTGLKIKPQHICNGCYLKESSASEYAISNFIIFQKRDYVCITIAFASAIRDSSRKKLIIQYHPAISHTPTQAFSCPSNPTCNIIIIIHKLKEIRTISQSHHTTCKLAIMFYDILLCFVVFDMLRTETQS